MDPRRGSRSCTGFCGDAPHGGGSQEICRPDEVVGEPLRHRKRRVSFFISLLFHAELRYWRWQDVGGVESGAYGADIYHVFRLLGEEGDRARAVTLNILLDKTHALRVLFPF